MCGGVIVPPFIGIPSTDGGSTAGNVTDGGALPSAVVMVAGVVVRPSSCCLSASPHSLLHPAILRITLETRAKQVGPKD